MVLVGSVANGRHAGGPVFYIAAVVRAGWVSTIARSDISARARRTGAAAS
jgi:hypothetical protein